MAKTFAQHLINSTLPEGYKMDGPVNAPVTPQAQPLIRFSPPTIQTR